ncbi:interleukin-12 subunit beta [Trichomycterus rosablanca]|uniref:interleukin-12 subunit beta n=1 Tax=Trichomycterus rosablanca TaxID=2290929 RepID=UPI002F360794
MNWTFLLVLHLILVHTGNSSSLRIIKPNVVALEVSGNPMEQKWPVSLNCGDQFEGTKIHWQKNGQDIPNQGNSINVTIEAMLGGNFTCLSPSNEILNHTLVLVRPVDFEKAIVTRKSHKEFITCLARNYSGTFHCSWKWDPIRNGKVVFFNAFRHLNVFNCTVDSNNTGITCESPQCPFSEEVSRINFTLLVRNQYRLEEHLKTFFIRDIIKPDRVNITKAENDKFEWKAPETWNSPCSYFQLQYEVKLVSHRRDCDAAPLDHSHKQAIYTKETHYEVSDKKSYTFCVRAQDPLTNNAWSDWSHHRRIKQKSRK